MKKIYLLFLSFLFTTSILTVSLQADSRFGDLTQLHKDQMRGKDGKWVRPHPGPFVWNRIEKEQGFFSWEDADKYVVYAQEHNQTTLATIWPYSNWDQKSCKRKKAIRYCFTGLMLRDNCFVLVYLLLGVFSYSSGIDYCSINNGWVDKCFIINF